MPQHRSATSRAPAKRSAECRAVSADDADFVARVQTLPPTVVGEVRFGFDPFRGDIVSIPCLPGDVVTDRGRDAILGAARIAIDRGAKVIGLGALTSPATHGGEWLVESALLMFRSRGDTRPPELVSAGRSDLLRETKDGLRLARREITVDEPVLRTQNLAVFL